MLRMTLMLLPREPSLLSPMTHEFGATINPEWLSFLKTILRLTDSATHDIVGSSYRKLMVAKEPTTV